MDLADELLEDLAASAEAEAEPSTGELVGKNRDVEVGTKEPPLIRALPLRVLPLMRALPLMR